MQLDALENEPGRAQVMNSLSNLPKIARKNQTSIEASLNDTFPSLETQDHSERVDCDWKLVTRTLSRLIQHRNTKKSRVKRSNQSRTDDLPESDIIQVCFSRYPINPIMLPTPDLCRKGLIQFVQLDLIRFSSH